MPRLHTKGELVGLALAVSASMTLVTHKGIVYEARDFETGEPSPSPMRAIWLAQTSDEVRDIADGLGIIFATPSEFESFKYMIKQGATRIKSSTPYVMIRHEDGLAYMTDAGLVPVTAPTFSPNFINHRIIPKGDEEYKYVVQLRHVIEDWVGGKEQARSLLYHLATSLQPGWSAVKYVLFLGAGRNGKGLLLMMIRKLLGKGNISGVLRQSMAKLRPTIAALNNKLANIVFDGPMTYIGDSGPEKTLIAGEPLEVEMKYENESIEVETNALFIESLNKEPKARDKSPALQARLVRFYFGNKYAKDLGFEYEMTSSIMLDALLTLLWEHWVKGEEIADKLAVSEASHDLQTTSVMDRSPILAWIEQTIRKDENLLEGLRSGEYSADTLAEAIQPWMQNQGYGDRTMGDIWEYLGDHFIVERATKRVGGRPVTVRLIKQVLPDTERALEAMEGATEDDKAVVRRD